MDFKLEISTDNTNYYSVDLFPNSELEYNVDFYDSLEIDKIKLPFSSNIKIPLTTLNKASNRFNYDPLTSAKEDFPKGDYYFKLTIYGTSNTIIEGILNVTSIEYNSGEPYIDVQLNDFVTKYINDLKNVQLYEIYDANSGSYGTYYRQNNEFNVFFTNTVGGGEAGIQGTNPSLRPIIFPYVDFVNDVHGKFGYAARQFTEYGVGLDRAGIIPVFNVKEFIYHLELYLTAQGFTTRVDSALFAQNYAEAIPDFEAEKLHFLVPAKLEADKDTNTRFFRLRQSPYWTGTNEDLYTDFRNDDPTVTKDFVTPWFWGNETFGNYGPSAEGGEQAVANVYGADITDDPYPEDELFGYERGYFAPHMSFSANIELDSGGSLAVINEIEYEIPVVNEDNMVGNIYVGDSNMTFNLFVGVFEDGSMVKKIRMEDVNGNPYTLEADRAAAVAGNSEKTNHGSGVTYTFFEETNSSKGVILEANDFPSYTDMLRWDLADLGQQEVYFPSGEEIIINGESRYGVNYFLEPVDGELRVRYSTDVTPHGSSHSDADTPVTSFLDSSAIRKAITRIPDYGQLNIAFIANANFNPYFSNDEYNIKESLQNTCTTTAYDVLLGICKRFNCGIFYEYDSVASKNVLRIDPLHLVRSGVQNVDQYIDDLKSAKVYIGGDKIKNLSLNNKDFGLYYDDEDGDGTTIGSTTQEINTDGVSDLDIDFKTAIYYKSVCGDATDDTLNQNYVNGVVSEKEIGFTPNLFTPYTDIGMRFAYVDKPLYKTNLKVPFAITKYQRANLYTKTQRIYKDWSQFVFNGRLRHFNLQDWNLLAEDESGNTTDYYTFYTDNEKIKYSNTPTVEFDMVVPTSDLADLDFLLQDFTATLITQETIAVKEASGDVYEDYAYLTIKGILK